MTHVRAIALYLPQFHPIPENDTWWGKGFTEWTNTAKAKPLFRGHYQPHIPADLGFYDLRVSETRVQQADLARRFGIEGFCYYHYWFGGKRILNRPMDEVVTSSSPDFPFCACWANESWTGVWHGAPKHTLLEQTYPGLADHRAHFETLLPAFRDRRYIRVNGKPLFLIYRPLEIPDTAATLRLWREMAAEAGLDGLHIVACTYREVLIPPELGYDASMVSAPVKDRPWPKDWRRPLARLRRSLEYRLGIPHVFDFSELIARSTPQPRPGVSYPCVIHAWDNTPRSGKNGVVYKNSDPKHFHTMLSAAVESVSHQAPDQRIVFLKSWNEWAEGNHLEPDLKYGTQYLEVVGDVISARGRISEPG